MELSIIQEALDETHISTTTATYDGEHIILNGKVIRSTEYFYFDSCDADDNENDDPAIRAERKLIEHVRFLPGVTAIGDSAFYGCRRLLSVILSEGLITIGRDAFCGCSSLSFISIPSAVTKIGDYAFFGCNSLSNISIPSTVTKIGKHAFGECALLSQLSLARNDDMHVVEFLRWRHNVQSLRFSVLTSLLRLRIELYARPKRVALAEEEEKEEEEEEEAPVEEEGGGGRSGEEKKKGDGKRLQGVLAFESITSADLWRYILEYV
jgi:hypothetical protein